MVRAFGYLRLSRDRDSSSSIDKQRASITDHATAKDWTVVDWFEDIDISGSRQQRPGLDAMLARLDDTDVIVFHRLDRIMRSVIGFAKLLERCQSHDVELVSATEPFDTSTAVGRSLVWLLASVAEIEVENTSSRIRATQEHLHRLGRPTHDARAYGWRSDWTHDPHEVEVIRLIVDRYVAGAGVVKIASQLNDGTLTGRPEPTIRGNEWSPTGVSILLKNPRLIGYTTRHGKPATDEPTLPAIIDADTFQLIQSELRRRRTWKQRSARSDAELTGLVVCSICNRRMYLSQSAGKAGYSCRGGDGHGMRIPKLWLEEHVASQLFEHVDELRLAEAEAAVEAPAPPDAELRAAVSRLEWGRDELLRDYYQEGRLDRDVFEEQLREVSERLEHARGKLEASLGPAALIRARTAALGDLRAIWPELEVDDRRGIFAATVRRVRIKSAGYQGEQPHPGRVEIGWLR